ncbi:MAG: 2-phospho-L-lactate guanylyltransferase [Burkholderiales bacterium]
MRPLWIIIPAQSFDRSKTRLAPLLDQSARRQFSRDCLIHVVRTARMAVLATRIVVVSRAAEALGLARRLGVQALRERGRGLNQAVTDASAFAQQRGAAATLVLHADLPDIAIRDILALRAKLSQHKGVVLAPDSLREGSNALGLRPPGAIRYHFGKNSFGKHSSNARGARRCLLIVDSPGLAGDIDTPENYLQFLNGKRRTSSI